MIKHNYFVLQIYVHVILIVFCNINFINYMRKIGKNLEKSKVKQM